MELAPEKISFSLLHELKKLYPFGPHNEEPVFFSKNLTPVQFRKIGKKQNHVKFKVMENPAVDFIGWNMADQEDLLVNSRLDILYQIQENFFRNQFYLQGNILAVRETVC
jgi:single-stranded-DNA-specific exonuclease